MANVPDRSRLPIAFLAAAICAGGCSHRPPLPLSDRFGDVAAPDEKQAVLVVLKDGREFEIRKAQAEHDTLYAVFLDYSFQRFPEDSIRSIRNVPRKSLEGGRAAWEDRDAGKEAEGRPGRSAAFAIVGDILFLGVLVGLLFLTL